MNEVLDKGQRSLKAYFQSQSKPCESSAECRSWDGLTTFFAFVCNSPGSSPGSSSGAITLPEDRNVAHPTDVPNTVVERCGLEIIMPGTRKAEEAEHEQQQQQAGQQALLEPAAVEQQQVEQQAGQQVPTGGNKMNLPQESPTSTLSSSSSSPLRSPLNVLFVDLFDGLKQRDPRCGSLSSY